MRREVHVALWGRAELQIRICWGNLNEIPNVDREIIINLLFKK
jgi:hypothetical protein